MKTVKQILFFLLFCSSFSSHATDVVLELGLHVGGDDILTAATPDGDEALTAGGGLSAAAGLKYDLSDSSSVQMTLGYKEESIGSSKQIKFSRNTLDLLYHSRLTDSFRLGVGPTLHLNTRLDTEGDGEFYAPDTDFDNALGILLDSKLVLGAADSLFLGLRLTLIEYKTRQNNLPHHTYDGSNIGFMVGFNL